MLLPYSPISWSEHLRFPHLILVPLTQSLTCKLVSLFYIPDHIKSIKLSGILIIGYVIYGIFNCFYYYPIRFPLIIFQ